MLTSLVALPRVAAVIFSLELHILFVAKIQNSCSRGLILYGRLEENLAGDDAHYSYDNEWTTATSAALHIFLPFKLGNPSRV